MKISLFATLLTKADYLIFTAECVTIFVWESVLRNNAFLRSSKEPYMGNELNNTVRALNALTQQYNEKRRTDIKCVHKTLLLRSLIILKHIDPESEKFFSPMVKGMMYFSKRPDRKGDYEKGMGRHYYCAVNYSGRKQQAVNGYYRNGIGNLYCSARTMFEENYTMALTMHRAGLTEQCAEHLGRSIHMISDICCLPHSTGMTYYSSARKMHKAYENFAEAIYPEFVPEQRPEKVKDLFPDRTSFEADINAIAADTASEMEALYSDPEKEVTERLYATERTIVSLLQRFMADTSLPEKEAHYITNSSGFKILPDSAYLTIKVTEKGLVFHGVNPSPESALNVTRGIFYAAHRHDGLYTISPAKNREGKVLEIINGKIYLRKFNPVHGEQLFRL